MFAPPYRFYATENVGSLESTIKVNGVIDPLHFDGHLCVRQSVNPIQIGESQTISDSTVRLLF